MIPTTPRATQSEPAADTSPAPVAGVPLDVDVDHILPNPWQPREHLDDHQLQELAQSIRVHGVMQPLVVSGPDDDGNYTLIAGERRWRASRLAGKSTVPVVVKDASPQNMLELAIIENVVRADLSPLEEATAYKQLIEDFGLTQADVAERVGRSRVAITNTLRLLNAPQRVQQAIVDGRITEGHARALLGLPSTADQLALLDALLAHNWSVRQTEEQVRKWLAGTPERRRPTPPKKSPDDERVESRLRDALGTKITLKRGSTGGAVVIDFYSDEQLQALLDRLVGEDLW